MGVSKKLKPHFESLRKKDHCILESILGRLFMDNPRPPFAIMQHASKNQGREYRHQNSRALVMRTPKYLGYHRKDCKLVGLVLLQNSMALIVRLQNGSKIYGDSYMKPLE